jgi:hypothetical protein
MLIYDHTVYSVFQSSTLVYTIQKLLASTYIVICVWSIFKISAPQPTPIVCLCSPRHQALLLRPRASVETYPESCRLSIVRKFLLYSNLGTNLLTMDCQSSHFLPALPTSQTWIRGECVIGVRLRLQAKDLRPIAG